MILMKPIPFPAGKLPPDFLAALLARYSPRDQRVLLGPGEGLDCAVIDVGDRLLVLKSDPITFVSDQAGWYAVQVNANDIATTGASPRWMLVTLLLPQGNAFPDQVEALFEQVNRAASALGISVVGGHTEVTHGIDRPILSAAMLGEVAHERLVTPRGAAPGDAVLLTKEVPIEAVSILAREFPRRLAGALHPAELRQAQDYLTQPGISVVRDASLAAAAGRVTAMHDPTEGGILAALWELSVACGCPLEIDPALIPVSPLAQKVCAACGVDPLAAIASGALLLTCATADAQTIQAALRQAGIACAQIGVVRCGVPAVKSTAGNLLPRPARDEIARLFDEMQS